jgi:capsule polysaccharide modification protein KpsS
MFAWLDVVLEEIKAHPEIFFIIRAHPDEERPGKESLETVSDWIKAHGVDQLPNVMYISPKQYISSYELIAHAKFVMVYNSTVGLEASVMGKPVLCAGKARYTQIPTVYFPKNVSQYRQLLADFLDAEKVEHPVEFQKNARRVLYSQLFRASLSFSEFIEDDGIWRGYIRMKNFHADDLAAEKSSTIEVVLNGILNNDPFIMEL